MSLRATRSCCALLGAAVLILGGPARARATVSPSTAIATLNQQREAAGIPGGIIENPPWSTGCDHHISYIQRNGGVLTHVEQADRPAYTADGAYAGAHAVLAAGRSSWSAGNPWEHAPIHLHQLLAPRLSMTGVADRDGYVCMITWPGYERPVPAGWVTYTYPAAGAVDFRFQELAAESPFTPGETVGIPAGTTTGPYLYVMFDGPVGSAGAAVATGASLTGPDGPVDIAVVDNTTPGAGAYLPLGMELIPRRPLRPRTAYTAAVSAVVSAPGSEEGPPTQQPLGYTWSFATAPRPNTVSVSMAPDDRRPSQARVDVESQAPAPTVTLTGPSGAVLHPVVRSGSAIVLLPAAGRWQACAVSGGLPGEYAAASSCATATFPARLSLDLPRRIAHRRLRLRVPAAAIGHRAWVTVYARARASGVMVVRRWVRLQRITTTAIPVSSGARRWIVTVTAGGFRRGGVRYERLAISRTYRRVR